MLYLSKSKLLSPRYALHDKHASNHQITDGTLTLKSPAGRMDPRPHRVTQGHKELGGWGRWSLCVP